MMQIQYLSKKIWKTATQIIVGAAQNVKYCAAQNLVEKWFQLSRS